MPDQRGEEKRDVSYETEVNKLRVETHKGGEQTDARDHEECQAKRSRWHLRIIFGAREAVDRIKECEIRSQEGIRKEEAEDQKKPRRYEGKKCRRWMSA